MAKRIHITETQLNEIMKRMDEMDQGAGTQINVQDTTGDGKPDVKGTYNKTAQQLGQTVANNATYTVGGEQAKNMSEAYKSVTKRQIKEARLNKLVKESVRMIKKKNLK